VLSKRIVGAILVRNEWVVQSIGFRRYLPIGRPEIAAEFLDDWGVDEILLVDLSASQKERSDNEPNYSLIKKVSRNTFVPILYSGGIAKLDHIGKAVSSGADKVALTTALVSSPALIEDGSSAYGSQCIVAGIDVQLDAKYGYRAFINGGSNATALNPLALAKRAVELGAGEVLVNSIPRDGSKVGFDVTLLRDVCRAVSAPVIGMGGAGDFNHFLEAFEQSSVGALVAGNMLSFSEHSVSALKAFLLLAGIQIRYDSRSNYVDGIFDKRGRILMKDEEQLAQMKYEHITPEDI
jgi:imidazole glycerol-phosphate synthase subunit HisF